MTTEERVKALFAEANPIPEIDSFFLEEMAGAAYLATIEQRSSEMTQLETKPIDQKKQRRASVMLVMAVVAALLVGAVVILTRTEQTPPPATQVTPSSVAVVETPTTVVEAVDPQVEEGLAIASAFVDALLIGDLAAAETYVGSGTVGMALLDEGLNSSVGPAGEVPWKEAMGWEAVFEGCTVTSSNPTTTGVQCSVTNSTAISRALGVAPYTSLHDYTVMYEGGSYFGQAIEDTVIVADAGDGDQWQRVGYEEFKAAAFDPFMTWLGENHRDDLEQVMLHAFSIGVFSPDRWLTGDHAPNHSQESVALWGQYSEAYIAQLDG